MSDKKIIEIDKFSSAGSHVINTLLKQKGYSLAVFASCIERIEFDGENAAIVFKESVKNEMAEIMSDTNKMAQLVGENE